MVTIQFETIKDFFANSTGKLFHVASLDAVWAIYRIDAPFVFKVVVTADKGISVNDIRLAGSIPVLKVGIG